MTPILILAGGKSLTLYRDVNTGQPCTQTKDDRTEIVDTQTCVAHEMGTCFLHNGYHVVRDLVSELYLAPEVAPEGRAMYSSFAEDKFHTQEMGDFITSSIIAGKSGLLAVTSSTIRPC